MKHFGSIIQRTGRRAGVLALAVCAVVGAPAGVEAQSTKKLLTVDDYSRWRSIEGSRISGDGNWVVYTLRHTNALDPRPVLHVQRLDSNQIEEVANAVQPAFSDDSRWVAYFVELPYAEAKKLRDGSKPVPRKVELRNLETGAKRSWEDVQSFSFANGSGHLLLRRRQLDTKAGHKGVDVVLHNLKTGRDQFLGSVFEAAFNRRGELLAYTVDAVERDANGLFLIDLRDGRLHTLDNDARNYARLAWSEEGTSVAVLKGQAIEKLAERENVLIAYPNVYAAMGGDAAVRPVTLDTTVAGFPRGTVVSDRRDLLWSADRRLVFLGTKAQTAAPDTADRKKGTDEVADVDVWNTRDVRIQSVQMSRAEADRNFTYRGAFDVVAGRFIVLTDSTMRDLDLTADGRWGIGRDDRAYVSDYGRPSADLYRVNPATGERTLILREQMTYTSTGSHIFGTSPDGKHFLYWRGEQFHVYNLDTGRSTPLAREVGGAAVLAKASGSSFVDLDFDNPGPKPAYGVAGWTRDGRGVVALHRYDLWTLPLDGGAPISLTRGVGDQNEVIFRYVNLEPLDGLGPLARARTQSIDTSKPLLLSAFGQWTKKSGYYELRGGQMKELVFDDAMFNWIGKAARADRVLFTRETFTEFPDLRVARLDFREAKKITDANPHHAEYAWGRRILFDFTNSKGVRLQGILAIPDDYRQGEKRPMLVNFYEKNSYNLHDYPAPSLLTSMGSIPTEALSRGYLMMQPDVHFNTGASHSDMLEAVEAATRKVIELGYADPARIGVHGHSYGGQGVAFIGTRSRMFAAIGMGAGVSDMTSDFSHNWGWSYQVPGSGSSAFDYYLYGQGRQGTNPWDNPELYRFESGRTHVREATAPFLIVHGTADGTVAFQEALGFYNALRFNGKTAVLLAYPGEGHSIRGLANRRDLTIRYLQFFDHYLRGEPAPKWLADGLPYLEKDGKRDPFEE